MVKKVKSQKLKVKSESKRDSQKSRVKTTHKKVTEEKKFPISLKTSKSSREPQTMEELLAQTSYQIHGLKRGSFIDGTIKSVSGKEVLIDVGAKTEGIVSEREIPYIRDFISRLKVGDKHTCYVVSPENEEGQVVLSLRKASSEQKWEYLYRAQKEGLVIDVKGTEVNKGGLIVEFRDLHGFIPASQMDIVHASNMVDLINKILSVKVVEIDRKNNRLIFSERSVSSKAQKENVQEILKKINIGDKCKGKVTGVVQFGIFVTLTVPEPIKNMEGLVHISEIAWEKVFNPADYFKLGDIVEVVILGVEEKTGKLNLSIKKLLPDPWQSLAKMYQKDQVVSGKVTRVSPYGVFVEIEKGIEGLLHISKIPSGREFTSGEPLECMIELVDVEKHRISLSLLPTEKPIGYK